MWCCIDSNLVPDGTFVFKSVVLITTNADRAPLCLRCVLRELLLWTKDVCACFVRRLDIPGVLGM